MVGFCQYLDAWVSLLQKLFKLDQRPFKNPSFSFSCPTHLVSPISVPLVSGEEENWKWKLSSLPLNRDFKGQRSFRKKCFQWFSDHFDSIEIIRWWCITEFCVQYIAMEDFFNQNRIRWQTRNLRFYRQWQKQTSWSKPGPAAKSESDRNQSPLQKVKVIETNPRKRESYNLVWSMLPAGYL